MDKAIFNKIFHPFVDALRRHVKFFRQLNGEQNRIGRLCENA
jgi:hypothetical protein